MRSVRDVAEYLIQAGCLESGLSVQEADAKLQTLLVCANLIALAETGQPLFVEPICAGADGLRVEGVKLQTDATKPDEQRQ